MTDFGMIDLNFRNEKVGKVVYPTGHIPGLKVAVISSASIRAKSHSLTAEAHLGTARLNKLRRERDKAQRTLDNARRRMRALGEKIIALEQEVQDGLQ